MREGGEGWIKGGRKWRGGREGGDEGREGGEGVREGGEEVGHMHYFRNIGSQPEAGRKCSCHINYCSILQNSPSH